MGTQKGAGRPQEQLLAQYLRMNATEALCTQLNNLDLEIQGLEVENSKLKAKGLMVRQGASLRAAGE